MNLAGSDPWTTLQVKEEDCRKAFDGTGKECFEVLVEEKPAGFVILQMAGSFMGYIQTLFIHSDFQGKGIGHQLLAYCESYVHQYSPNLFICVSSFNTGAIRLYEAFGFSLVGTLYNFIPGRI
jgi:ribosomal protein S18 acetylase RimI-like enzyme